MNTLNQEADMGYVRDFVAKVAEALVAATELPKQIAEITNQLSTLELDLERTKSRNIELDTMLADTRRQRDEAEQALSQVKSDLSQSQAKAERLDALSGTLHETTQSLKSEIEALKKERDDYGMKQMEAEERASQAEAKLAKLAEALGLPKPEAKPVPEPVKPTPPEPFTTTDTSLGVALPEPTQAQPEPTPPKRMYEGEPGYYDQSQNKLEKFDSNQRRYYIEL